MKVEFSDRAVLITGGGSGIGLATARRFAENGARVMVADQDGPAAEGAAEELRGAGAEAFAHRVDVTDPAQCEAMVAAALERFGRLDFAVNSAGIGGVRAKTAEHAIDAWRRIVEVNLVGVWLSMKYEIPAILRGGAGAIVNLASVAGVIGFANHSAYAASKHGVIGLTRSAALEYAKTGLRINAVCPAFTRTPMVDALVDGNAEREAKLAAAIPLGRLGDAREVADSIVYLCSDAAAFITGQQLVLDGGLSAG